MVYDTRIKACLARLGRMRIQSNAMSACARYVSEPGGVHRHSLQPRDDGSSSSSISDVDDQTAGPRRPVLLRRQQQQIELRGAFSGSWKRHGSSWRHAATLASMSPAPSG